jgi:hypothetical protein
MKQSVSEVSVKATRSGRARINAGALSRTPLTLGTVRATAVAIALFAATLLAPGAAQADFGIRTLSAGAFNEDGSPDLQAASRPYEFRLDFELNQNSQGNPEGTLRELRLDLPGGMVGDPFALPRCSAADFEGVSPHCPGNTQVGVALIHTVEFENPTPVPIYNLTPPLGAPAMIGLSIAGNNSFQEASLRSADYGVRISDLTIPTGVKIQSVQAKVWGLPAAASHDPDRVCQPNGVIVHGCSSESAPAPFLTLPSACQGPLEWRLGVDSVAEPDVLQEAGVRSEGPGGLPRGLGGCDKPQFVPTIAARPETAAADSPTGLHFSLHIPQNEAVSQVALPAMDETQSLDVKARAGGFVLSFEGQESGELPFDATAAEVQSALAGLSTIGTGNVAVSGGADGFYTIAFIGALADQPLPLIEVHFSGEGSAALTLFRQGRPPGKLGPEPAIATANLKDTVITLPRGLVLNPSAAAGRVGCPLTGPEGINLPGSGEPAQSEAAKCPPASEVGTVAVHSPLLDHPAPGTVYLARQGGENPFGSLIALYVAIDDPITDVVVKLAGKVVPDPVTGQLTATFLDNPQLPFEDFDFDFFGGPRAALTTPSTCGTFTTTSDLTPWTTPEGADAFPSDSFQIDTGANGAACPSSESQEPNSPAFQAGTASPLAASYSPFVMHLSRGNGSQRLSAINVTLPPGLTGKLAGVAQCSDAQLAAAAARSNPGQGALEQASPACPQSSEVGTVTVGAGSGAPFYAPGHAYLAGPYKGAPFSLAIITPAVAGPFDLGSVLVRAGLYVDPNTAQVTVRSDPLPTILQGIPLDVRSIQVNIDRPEFTLNPTSCEPMSVGAQALSTAGQTASLSSRFQAGGCQGLPFKPTFTASTQGKTSKANGASLTVKVSQKPGEANIHKVALTLPLALPARLTTLQKACTEQQFAINPAGCPQGSFIGTARAITPLLSVPLVGPAILVSHGGAAFPDVEFLLQGEGVQITLDGKTDIKKGITHSRFETVPDAPISSFETVLPQGPHSALAANANLCTSKLSMPTQLTGQNGALVNQTTKIAVTGCPRTLTRAQKLALALKACHKKKGAKRASCERLARRKYAPVKRKGKR